jgi:hypothetical protein
LLIGVDPHCRTIAGRFAFATPHGDDSFVAVGINVETIIAGLQRSERLVGRIDFVFLAVV